jgi:F-type H+-transporting ATPase subunit delta
MSVKRIAARYAKTLLEEAKAKDVVEATYKELLELRDLIEDHEELQNFLASPIIAHSKKANALLAIVGDENQGLLPSFLRLICHKGRAPHLSSIIEAFIAQYRALKEITQVSVSSATALDETALQALEKSVRTLKGVRKHVEWEHTVDPDLIGGFVIQFDDKIYDTSVAHQLNRLRKKIAH